MQGIVGWARVWHSMNKFPFAEIKTHHIYVMMYIMMILTGASIESTKWDSLHLPQLFGMLHVVIPGSTYAECQ